MLKSLTIVFSIALFSVFSFAAFAGEPVVDVTYDNTENKTKYDFKDPIEVEVDVKEPKEVADNDTSFDD